MVWEVSRGWMLAWGAGLIVLGLIPGGIVYTTKWLVDAVDVAMGGGLAKDNVLPVLVPLAVMGGLLITQQVLQRLIGWVQAVQGEIVQDAIKAEIHRKATEIDFSFFDRPDFYDLLQQADSQASSRALSIVRNVGTVVRSAITFVSIAAILATYSIWLPVVLFVGAVPAVWLMVRQQQRYHAWWRSVTHRHRWAAYLNLLLINRFNAAEVRLYDAGPYLAEQYQDVRRELREANVRLQRDQAIAGIVAGLLALLMTAGVMGWMVWRAFIGAASLGDLALFYQAVNQAQSLVRSLLGTFGDLYTSTLYLEHVFQLLDMEAEQREPVDPVPVPRPIRQGIHFEHVTFAYPDSDRPALQDFSLEVPAGGLVAVVGANGAGKSTLTKLLCRLYDPQEGRVLIDGVDLRQMNRKELQRRISIMFQFPVQYQTTVWENLALGNREAARKQLREAARYAKAHEFIERLPRGYDTVLGRLFSGGAELSGGQWQRIALARAYAREADIVVLDEPTSFMDSWAELEWLRLFKQMVQGRTALIITHRFSTAMHADVIHVMDDGAVVESGTHQELLERGGLYAASWQEQMKAAGERNGVTASSSPFTIEEPRRQ